MRPDLRPLRPLAALARVLLPVALLPVVLAGCGPGGSDRPLSRLPAPVAAPTRTGSPVASAVAPSPRPTPADPTSDAAVLAAVQDLARALTVAAQTSDVAAFLAMTTPTCRCRTGPYVDFVRKRHRAGVTSDAVFTAEAQITGRRPTAARVSVGLMSSAATEVDAAGHQRSRPRESTRLILDLVIRAGRWRVDYLSTR